MAENLTSFKYYTGNKGIYSLKSGIAYFASPHQLNDSLEAKFELAGATHYNDALAKALNELARTRSQENYAFDMAGYEEFERIHKRENERFQDACQKIGIFSTSRRYDNQAMWAYYCNDLKGVCFEFEWSSEVMNKYQLVPTDVQYSNQTRIHNRAIILGDLLLEAGLQNPDWTIKELQEFSLSKEFLTSYGVLSVACATSTKHTDWQHENELRIISAHAGELPIMRDILKRVFFTGTDFQEWGTIMTLLQQQYPNVEIAQLIFDHKEPLVKIVPMEYRLIPA